MSKVKNILIPVGKIVLAENNPRTITEKDFEKLKEDITADPTFLEQRPPLINLVDGKHICYAGNQRVKACIELGYKSIKCFVEENVPKKVQDERMLKDNLHRGDWDQDLLLNMDFEIIELEDLGFEDTDLTIVSDGDFQSKNGEVDTDLFEDEMTLKLKYPESIYNEVRDKLSQISQTPEEAIKSLLKIE